MTHETSSRPAESEPCRCGSTTLVTLVSRICMKATTMTVKVMAHFWVGETGAEAGGLTFPRGPPRVGPIHESLGHGQERHPRLRVRGRREDPPRRPAGRCRAALRVRYRHLRDLQGPARARADRERVER